MLCLLSPPEDYNNIEREIAEMMQENTGTHVLDSGGAYGRSWQRNRAVKDFRQQNELVVEVYQDGDICFSLNIFHYLTSYLRITDKSKELNERLQTFIDAPENRSNGYLQIMEDFAEKLKDEGIVYQATTDNSYNSENLLSQVIQGIYLNLDGRDYPDLFILQIHGGCDVRGGYTRPRLFAIIDFDYMVSALVNLTASCACKNEYYYSDDCGYHWYENGGYSPGDKNVLPDKWKPRPKFKGASSSQYRFVCQKCRKEVNFNAALDP